MWNPFQRNSITISAQDAFNMIVAKEAELMLARGQLQQAAQMLEQLKAENSNLRQQLEKKSAGSGPKPVDPANSVPDAVK